MGALAIISRHTPDREKRVTIDLDKLVSLCKRRGFIFQSSEIYGGLASTWDYGPLGAELKRNVKDSWWRSMVLERDDMVGLDSAIIMHPEVWRASGHVESFTDRSSSASSATAAGGEDHDMVGLRLRHHHARGGLEPATSRA